MRLLARAKINWTLDISGQRADGYHLMDMLMQPVTLADEITIEPADRLSLTTGGEPFLPADEHHLALRAARALSAYAGVMYGAHIHVHKRIPVGAGMGGGSADAAGVLHGLNRFWDLNYNVETLQQIGLGLGADVPFCVRGGWQRTTGIGEIMENLGPCPDMDLCVIQPCDALSTKQVFAGYHAAADIRHPDTDAAIRAIREGDMRALDLSAANVLQQVSEKERPQITEAICALKKCGADFAAMTGSGSAVFGAFASKQMAETACAQLSKRWGKCWNCHTCSESVIQL